LEPEQKKMVEDPKHGKTKKKTKTTIVDLEQKTLEQKALSKKKLKTLMAKKKIDGEALRQT